MAIDVFPWLHHFGY